ncbi:hypothetical protein [Brumimicrobium glaciale]|jgi:hypothetical protein|uniref:hypothetical protein n=1 Tax=Brumimicrobium glaciale TaxID=200475 RepID=UPI0013ED5E7A|nr:hypothetical protein [Brumimicrobium glaciale]
MKLNFRVILGLGLVAITVYDIIVAGFHFKHAIFLGIAALAIFMALNKNKV